MDVEEIVGRSATDRRACWPRPYVAVLDEQRDRLPGVVGGREAAFHCALNVADVERVAARCPIEKNLGEYNPLVAKACATYRARV